MSQAKTQSRESGVGEQQRRPCILFISHESSRTGAPIFLLRFLRWLNEQGDLSFHVLVGSKGSLYPEFAALGPADSFEPEPTFLYRLLRKLGLNRAARKNHQARLRQLLAARQIDLIYSNTIVNGEILEFLSFLDCPVITHVHELENVIRFFGERNTALVKARTDRFIAVSGAVARGLTAAAGIPAEKIETIYGFIPIPVRPANFVQTSRREVREELQVSGATHLVCGCGSIEPRKGINEFLKVAHKVVAQNPAGSVLFLWVGGGAAQIEAALATARSLGVEGHVRFLGVKQDVARYFAASDVFFLSSLEDPFPLVMMEAALQGLPIVCFQEAGGAPEFVADDAGFAIPGFDLDLAAARITELLRSPVLRRDMGAVGAERVLTQHRLELGAAALRKAIYASLEASRRPVVTK